MKNIDNCLFEYLEAKRHVWNTYFMKRFTSIKDCSPLDEYEEIDRLLFKTIVLSEIEDSDLKEWEFNQQPINFIQACFKKYITAARVMVSGLKGGAGKWQYVDVADVKSIKFVFIEFFEWNKYGFVTYPYVRVRIEAKGNNAIYNGLDALLDLKDITFCLRTNK
ncbi:MAG: hypothetical protein JNN05_05685 [Candidatus Omnitrophica bacterium]|nr:hypothetical protein [Candidatus Omnitrophota bacterium]